MNRFTELTPRELNINVFGSIGSDWMLISAGNENAYNPMTASWGGLGHLWNKNVALCFIRPQRHTFSFVENNELFTLSFFAPEYKDALRLCGAKSGRDIDKAKEAGLTPYYTDGTVSFKEASLILVCKKIYADWLKKDKFIDSQPLSFYPAEDFHKMYVGEILHIYQNQ